MNKKWLLLALGVLIVMAGVYQFWYSDTQDKKQDEQKFEQIETVTADLSQRIVNNLGVTFVEKDEYCEYETRKFEDGPLVCRLSYAYTTSDYDVAEVIDFILQQTDVVQDATGSTRYNLNNTDASCIVSSAARDTSNDQSMQIICTADANTSYYELR